MGARPQRRFLLPASPVADKTTAGRFTTLLRSLMVRQCACWPVTEVIGFLDASRHARMAFDPNAQCAPGRRAEKRRFVRVARAYRYTEFCGDGMNVLAPQMGEVYARFVACVFADVPGPAIIRNGNQRRAKRDLLVDDQIAKALCLE
jgi:hypothetical protein